MSKAILTMDMPTSCEECRLKLTTNVNGFKDYGTCIYTKTLLLVSIRENGRLINCPLKKLPKLYELLNIDSMITEELDEILGGDNE